MSKSAVVVFARELIRGILELGTPRLSKYTYLGVDFVHSYAHAQYSTL